MTQRTTVIGTDMRVDGNLARGRNVILPGRFKTSRLRLLLVGLLTLVIATVAPPSAPAQDGLENTPKVRGPGIYKRALRQWTRELKLYRRFETKLLMRAVFKSEGFRDRYTREYARRYVLPPDDYALMREREMDDAARFHEVLFAVWASDNKGGHFVGDDAPWQIRLLSSDGRDVAPLVLQRIKRPSTEVLELYPFITPHDRVFIAKFPVLGQDGTPLLQGEDDTLRLRVSGVLARGEMTWP